MALFGVRRGFKMLLSHIPLTSLNLREFVKTHVILAPVREFSRSRAASKIPFPGTQPGQPGEFHFFHVRCKNRYVRSHVI